MRGCIEIILSPWRASFLILARDGRAGCVELKERHARDVTGADVVGCAFRTNLTSDRVQPADRVLIFLADRIVQRRDARGRHSERIRTAINGPRGGRHVIRVRARAARHATAGAEAAVRDERHRRARRRVPAEAHWRDGRYRRQRLVAEATALEVKLQNYGGRLGIVVERVLFDKRL